MRRFVSVVLVIACIGLCACKKKDKESKVKDTINPAFLSEQTLEDWCEEQDWVNYSDIDWSELLVLANENKDASTGYMTDEAFEKWASETSSNKLIYSLGARANDWLMCTLQDADSLHYHIGDIFRGKIETKSQGLDVSIQIKENYELSDKYDSMEDYLKTVHASTDKVPEWNAHEVIETSSGILFHMENTPYYYNRGILENWCNACIW